MFCLLHNAAHCLTILQLRLNQVKPATWYAQNISESPRYISDCFEILWTRVDIFDSVMTSSKLITNALNCLDLDKFKDIWTDLERTGKILQDAKGYIYIYKGIQYDIMGYNGI